MAATNRNSAAKARVLEHQRQAIELRRAGRGYADIAAALGISTTTAHRIVTAGLKEVREHIAAEAAELKAEEVSRLDGMLAGLWTDARKGHLGAIDRVLKIMERRAKLLGLDSPVKVAPTTTDGEDREDPAHYIIPVPPGMDLQAWLQAFAQSAPPSTSGS